MRAKTIFRFALLCALLGASWSTAAGPAFAQKDTRGRSGTLKEERGRDAPNKNKEGRGGSGTNKSDGRGDASKGRKQRR